MPFNNEPIYGVFSFLMNHLCYAMLDACPGALALFDNKIVLLHTNPLFTRIYPNLRVGMSWPEVLDALGTSQEHAARDGARFTAVDGDDLCGIEVTAFSNEGDDMFLLSAKPIAAQQELKRGLRSILSDAKGGALDRRLVLPPGDGVAQRRCRDR